MKDIEFRVERGPVAQNEPFAIGMAKLLEREGKTVAAAELRRLSSVEAQSDALRAELKEATEAINDPAVNNLRTLPESIRVLCVQRDALLEALKSTGLFLRHCWCDVQMNDHSFEKLNRQMEIVDAAIKAVEGEKA